MTRIVEILMTHIYYGNENLVVKRCLIILKKMLMVFIFFLDYVISWTNNCNKCCVQLCHNTSSGSSWKSWMRTMVPNQQKNYIFKASSHSFLQIRTYCCHPDSVKCTESWGLLSYIQCFLIDPSCFCFSFSVWEAASSLICSVWVDGRVYTLCNKPGSKL